ncbi:MAG TPA: CDP-alcohol phosphatidyltransferase family protein [Ignavibacteria bacterium]|nr:CDP-alcohol phosphatidyltransferase family protein [Ignavibacteria bacterium]HRF66355.1 CDP-alcohol phosphatidyltransferase family protein [Ignavibacteria bacterium]HRJ04333.1 CDP-alcohol phosphatidyltransferase family protein [Ignavibacteria bacterium]HRJ86759.1 CDP-alcohol phosphatidyltransferase family protein [Ignavibacteria bacterium]
MNFPNTLSLIRILLAPVFLYLFVSDSAALVSASFFVYTVAALTDWYDGWYARRYGFKTRWGQFIDPLADKILTSAAFIGFFLIKQKNPDFFGSSEPVPFIFLIAVIILRDIVLTAARSIQELRGKDFRTSMISKTKTFIQMIFIFLILAMISISAIASGSTVSLSINAYLHSQINYYILLLITLLTAASGIAYIFESGENIEKQTFN